MTSDFEYRCQDCGSEDPLANQYVVRDAIWRLVFPSRAGICCIPCLQRRLGRRLRPGDFFTAPINALIRERLAYLAGPPDPEQARALRRQFWQASFDQADANLAARIQRRATWRRRRPPRRRRR